MHDPEALPKLLPEEDRGVRTSLNLSLVVRRWMRTLQSSNAATPVLKTKEQFGVFQLWLVDFRHVFALLEQIVFERYRLRLVNSRHVTTKK